jgi:DNA-binding CsgD family transcriptional regulator
MESLTFNDIHRLNHGIQEIYALKDSIAFGFDAIRIINQLIPSNIAGSHVTNIRTGQAAFTGQLGLPDLSTERLTELVAVHTRCFYEHPVAENFSQTLNGAYKISDFISRKELHSREGLYQSFLRPLGSEDQMTLFLPSISGNSVQLSGADATFMGFSLDRDDRSFTERDRLILNLLRPHLLQAYDTVQHHQQLQQDFDRLQQSVQAVGMVVLNVEGRVQMMTSQSSIWLEAYFPNPNSGAFPDHLWSWVKYQAASIMNTADSTPPCLPLRIQRDGRQLSIRLILKPGEDRYLLLLEEQATSLLDSLGLLGLSQRETEVLGWIIQGKENKTIAMELGVSESTVRRHLESIYGKFGVNSRTEAIAYALQNLGILDSSGL